jgi:hypothetical protein
VVSLGIVGPLLHPSSVVLKKEHFWNTQRNPPLLLELIKAHFMGMPLTQNSIRKVNSDQNSIGDQMMPKSGPITNSYLKTSGDYKQ